MKKINIVLLVFLGLFLAGCIKDDGNLWVHGRVYDPLTGEGISGQGVRLVKGNSLPPNLDNVKNDKVLQSVTTDENGYYEIVDYGAAPTYVIFFDDPDSDKYRSDIKVYKKGGSDFIIEKNEEHEIDYQLYPYTQAQFRYFNANCDGEFDKLIVTRNYVTLNNESTYSHTIDGCVDFTTNVTDQFIAGDWHYHFELHRNSGITQWDTIFTAIPNQLNFFEIIY